MEMLNGPMAVACMVSPPFFLFSQSGHQLYMASSTEGTIPPFLLTWLMLIIVHFYLIDPKDMPFLHWSILQNKHETRPFHSHGRAQSMDPRMYSK